MIVATPGRLLDLLNKGKFKLQQCKYVFLLLMNPKSASFLIDATTLFISDSGAQDVGVGRGRSHD
jgi:hypothetical protein